MAVTNDMHLAEVARGDQAEDVKTFDEVRGAIVAATPIQQGSAEHDELLADINKVEGGFEIRQKLFRLLFSHTFEST